MPRHVWLPVASASAMGDAWKYAKVEAPRRKPAEDGVGVLRWTESDIVPVVKQALLATRFDYVGLRTSVGRLPARLHVKGQAVRREVQRAPIEGQGADCQSEQQGPGDNAPTEVVSPVGGLVWSACSLTVDLVTWCV